MKLIVGLGNPGDKYQATRHNAGFWFVERLAARSGTVLRKDGKFQALVGRHEGSGAWLVLPQSFMNASGRPVQMMASFFKIDPADVLVIHDELDLPPGTARLKQGGGVAGHNGLKDISARLGSHDYWRLRLGVGRPPEKGAAVEFVLHKPPQDERAAIDEAIERGLDVLPLVLAGDLQGAMLKLHTQEPQVIPEAPKRPARPSEAPQPDKPPPQSGQPAPLPQVPDKDEKENVEKAALPGPVAQAPAAPVEKTSSIEKFGRVAQAGTFPTSGNTAAVEKAATAGQAQRLEQATEAPKAGKKGGLNSLLKKFLPGADPSRKK